MDHILSGMAEGAWPLDELAEGFLSSLKQANGLNSDSVAVQSIARYQREIPIPPRYYSSLPLLPDPKLPTESAFWSRIVNKVLGGDYPLLSDDSARAELNPAQAKVGQVWPQAGRFLDRWMESFVFLKMTDQYSASNPHFWGVLFLASGRTGDELATSLIHELAHQELFLINLVDRLLTEPASSGVEYSPYQRKDRPGIGRLHSAHALFRMIQWHEHLGDELNRREHARLLAETVQSFRPEDLTELGGKIVNGVYKEASRVHGRSM